MLLRRIYVPEIVQPARKPPCPQLRCTKSALTSRKMGDAKMMSYVSKLRPSNGFSLGKLMDMWQTRFLVLKDGRLSYYKDEKAHKSGEVPRGTIDLTIATVFNQTQTSKKFEVTVRTPGRDYRFRFQTAELLQHWCEALEVHENVKTVNKRLKQEITPKFEISSNIPLPNATKVISNQELAKNSLNAESDSEPSTPTSAPHAEPSGEMQAPATSDRLLSDSMVSSVPTEVTADDGPAPFSPRTPRSTSNTPKKREKQMIVPKFTTTFSNSTGKLGGLFSASGKLGSSSKSLGSTNSLMTPDELGFEVVDNAPKLCGIGIVFRPQPNGTLRVRKLLEGSGAAESGQIQIGDLLVGVDDLEISEKTTPEEISRRVLGKPGGQVLLRLIRKGEDGEPESVEANITRTMPANAQPTIVSNPWKSHVSQHQYLDLVDKFKEQAQTQAVKSAAVQQVSRGGDDYMVAV